MTALSEKQEVFCLDLSEGLPMENPLLDTPCDTAIRINYHGTIIEVTNHAAQDTISNTFLALRSLC